MRPDADAVISRCSPSGMSKAITRRRQFASLPVSRRPVRRASVTTGIHHDDRFHSVGRERFGRACNWLCIHPGVGDRTCLTAGRVPVGGCSFPSWFRAGTKCADLDRVSYRPARLLSGGRSYQLSDERRGRRRSSFERRNNDAQAGGVFRSLDEGILAGDAGSRIEPTSAGEIAGDAVALQIGDMRNEAGKGGVQSSGSTSTS